ncbi:MAG TPA: mechanosensitive ion channel family protein [Gammaproteobacteria bacterium]|nr:mechanosensitive ion channel family protein [Gammaproteobacteria bacterium]
MSADAWHRFLALFEGQWLWIAQVFIVVFAALLVDFIQKRVVKRLLTRVAANRVVWDDALLDAAQRPLTLLIWIVGITFAAEIVGQNTEAAIFKATVPIRDVGVIAALAWFLVRVIAGVEQRLIAAREAEGKRVDRTTADAVSKLLRFSVIITAALVALQTLGFSISGVLAFGGIGGLAVGFAAKDLLSNFFGGLMVYMDRPFSVGDWVRSPDRNIEGTVEKIGWRLTCIRTFDKRPLYVPNQTFTTIAVENPSRMTNRRIYETVGIRYDDAGVLRAIVEEVKAMLQGHPDIDPSQTLIVNFNAFGPSSLDFFIYTFTRTTNWVDYHAVKQDVLLRVNDIIAAHGAEIAFPTSTVHVPAGIRLSGYQAQDEAGTGADETPQER